MTALQFSQALLSEHLLLVSCQSYRPVDEILFPFNGAESSDQKLCLALPYNSLHKHREQISSLNIWKGLSDIPSVTPGSFSENAAISLAKEAGIDFVVLGDNNARQVLYESDQSVAAKIRALLNADITPVVCFGETLQDHDRGNGAQAIQNQLTALLLGLTFDQVTRVVLVYKCPWINYAAPENFAAEYDKVHNGVLNAMQHLFGKDATSNIAVLTDLPLTPEDFTKISYEIPPSGYFLELGGRDPQLIAEYFNIITHTTPRARRVPKLTPPKLQPTPAALEPPPPPKKGKKSRKKSMVEDEIEEGVEDGVEEGVEGEESLHDTILSVEHELDEPTIHFELREQTQLAGEGSSEEGSSDDFDFEWYSDEELDALRKEFGIHSDGTITPQPLPTWDSSRPVRIIKTLAQKAKKSPKTTKSPKKK